MMRRRLAYFAGALALAAVLSGCQFRRGEDRVWRPGDPDVRNAAYDGPYSSTMRVFTPTAPPPSTGFDQERR